MYTQGIRSQTLITTLNPSLSPVISQSLKGAGVNWERLMEQGMMGSSPPAPVVLTPAPAPTSLIRIISETMRDDWGRVSSWSTLDQYSVITFRITISVMSQLDFVDTLRNTERVSINTHQSVNTQPTINYRLDVNQDVNGVSTEMSIDVQTGLSIDTCLWVPC